MSTTSCDCGHAAGRGGDVCALRLAARNSSRCARNQCFPIAKSTDSSSISHTVTRRPEAIVQTSRSRPGVTRMDSNSLESTLRAATGNGSRSVRKNTSTLGVLNPLFDSRATPENTRSVQTCRVVAPIGTSVVVSAAVSVSEPGRHKTGSALATRNAPRFRDHSAANPRRAPNLQSSPR